MAEKSPPRKRPAAGAAKQQMLETVQETSRLVQERREAEMRPEDRIEHRNAQQAVATADLLSTDGVVRSIGELRSNVGKTLAQLSDRLEEEVAKYVHIQRAILAKEAELKEIYDIQKNASTLTALIEAQHGRREEFDAELQQEKESLTREIEATRAEWDAERGQREAAAKEQAATEQKRREREREEYRYAFAREQQIAKDRFTDETTKAEKALADRTTDAERQLAARERAVAEREEELKELRSRVALLPKEMETAISKASKEAAERARADGAAREELLQREFAGERNVQKTRIAALEQTVKEQADQISRLAAQSEKAYAQVQDIAVKAIEGSSASKSLNSLQQALADSSRRAAEK